MNICEDRIEKDSIESSFYIMRAVYVINNNYDGHLVTNDLRRKSRKMDIFEDVVGKIANDTVNGKNYVLFFLN